MCDHKTVRQMDKEGKYDQNHKVEGGKPRYEVLREDDGSEDGLIDEAQEKELGQEELVRKELKTKRNVHQSKLVRNTQIN